MTEPSLHEIHIHQTPDLLCLHESNPAKYPFLLESVAKNQSGTNYDILFACPQAHMSLDSSGELTSENLTLQSNDVFEAFNAWFLEEQVESKSEYPFVGGWFVYLAYEFAQFVEPSLHLPMDLENKLPVANFTRIPAAILINHTTGQASIVSESQYLHLAEEILQDLDAIGKPVSSEKSDYDLVEEMPDRYLSAVGKIKDYIIDGDVFQVNLSREWKATLRDEMSPGQVYENLRKANPAPFAGLAVYEEGAILSSSPERLVRVSGNIVDTRPIAGTRHRARNEAGEAIQIENERLKEELIGHPKERAEHVMLIDLERNDLGRVCQPGSVEVDELMVLETYEHVHHIVSNVKGCLKDGILPMDVIKAVFPGGTITGCPKVRCMEIIAELEQAPRMAYTGSIGYINRNGDMDLNILIRTIIQIKNELFFRAGAGIVADSDPEKELQETRAKAKGLLNAL